MWGTFEKQKIKLAVIGDWLDVKEYTRSGSCEEVQGSVKFTFLYVKFDIPLGHPK